jgi:seryl-tRNA synthetase
MLKISVLRNEKNRVIEGLIKRNFPENDFDLVEQIIALDDQRKADQTELDQLLNTNNNLSKSVGQLFQQKKMEEANEIKIAVSKNKIRIKELEQKIRETKESSIEKLLNLPNVPHESVPGGHTEADNEVHKDWNKPLPDLPQTALPHWELAEKYKLIDFKIGAKITGSGFPLFRGKGAKLQRALVNFFLAQASAAGFEEITPPLMVNEDSARATGQLPDKEGQMYHVGKDNLYLIPTSEVPVTNILRNDIVDMKDLPIKFTSYTPCFRREAGSYGSHVKGLNRVHQFDKVEIVQVTHPDKSYQALQEMCDHVESLLIKLELPYRILRLCGGDLGFTSSLTFDFEVWSAAQKKWLEVSSVSNFESYQSNRLKLRMRDGNQKPQLTHTLNGSALALARIVAALLENNQDEHGINIPNVLQPFTGFKRID